ncbi:MAG: Methyltransferase domain protein [Lentisphaerae bacterium ADurb.BinA184]|nr:MAG: Methyltransferase domain protein [Lentisphaerae bacterium ADurb.BinA184]
MKRRRILRHYEGRLAPGRPSHEVLDWASRDAQHARFAAIARALADAGLGTDPAVTPPLLLDVGCGLADLRAFLQGSGLAFRYVGVDLSPRLLCEAHIRQAPAALAVADVFAHPPFRPGQFDVVVCSGALNLELGNNEAFLHHAIASLCALARRCVCLNALHERARRHYRHCHYYAPATVATAIRQFLARPHRVRFDDDYLDNDFTVRILMD